MISLTQQEIYDLNNMNVAAQRAMLGDKLAYLLDGGGGTPGEGGGTTKLIQRESYLDFPNIGNSQFLYIDTTESTMYRWSDDDLKYYSIGCTSDFIRKMFNTINGGNANG